MAHPSTHSSRITALPGSVRHAESGASHDFFGETIYRDLMTALDAVESARFFGAEAGIGYEPVRALEFISVATVALEAARAKLEEARA